MFAMNPLITFETPKKYVLQGVWLGKPRAKTVYIFLHGLTGNLFTRSDIAAELAKGEAACLMFNNRGHAYISPLRHIDKKKTKSFGGTAHEVFTDSRDDIAGAVSFAKSRGAKRVVLVGHSTGCQKAVWYLAGKPDRVVKGAVLLAPLSDYAGIRKAMIPARYGKLRTSVEKLAKKDPHTLVPQQLLPFPELVDAKRWLSLYTPESAEEIFTYASGKTPAALRKTEVPLLAIFASEDQYADRPAKDLATWFRTVRPKQPIDTRVVEAPNHAFTGSAKPLAKMIRGWSETF
jgi:pimeloyl-ACP methyl ester carboxylesterase